MREIKFEYISLENNKFMDKDTHNSLEVIGNIYENKELLKEVDENR